MGSNIGHAIGIITVTVGGAIASWSLLGPAYASIWLVVFGIGIIEANR